MLRPKAVALALLLSATACGDTPVELHTAAERPAVVQVDPPRPLRQPPATTSTTVAPTTTTSVATTTTTTEPRQPSTPTPHPAPSGDGCGGWRATIAAHFPAGEVVRACRVMLCESNGSTTADNPSPRSTASGLFGFLDGTWHSVTGRADRALNATGLEQVAAAAALWAAAGWSQWSCR